MTKTITLRYFARFRELLNCEQEALTVAATDIEGVEQLLMFLKARGGPWAEILGDAKRVLVSINHSMASRSSRINDGDEVGIFPPVTGG